MAPLDPHLRRDLVHPDPRTFEEAARAVRERWGRSEEEERHRDLLAILSTFASDPAIGATEVARRGRLLFDAARLPGRLAAGIARSARSWPPALRNAVLGGLPPALRRLAYDTAADRSTPPAAAPEPAVLPFPAPTAEADRDAGRTCSTVLLLGTAHEHEGNHALLLRHGFTPYRVSEREHLDALLTEDLCGLVVSRGWWVVIPEPERRGLLDRLLRHSSFMWVRLDTHSLPCAPAELEGIIRSARFEVPTAFEFTYPDGFQITPADIPHIERACAMLCRSNSVRLCPAEIQEHHARVLVGAASKHVRGRDGEGLIRLTTVQTSILPGGRSSAKIFRIIPDDGGPPLVAKMDGIACLQEEMRRFQRYALRWDERLAPPSSLPRGDRPHPLLARGLPRRAGRTGADP